MRGGSWDNHARNVRAAYRNANDPGNRNSNLGLRLARAQAQAGGSAPDPPHHPSVRPSAGRQTRRGADVLVARMDVRASARRRLAFPQHGAG